jgi:hypothetical protein
MTSHPSSPHQQPSHTPTGRDGQASLFTARLLAHLRNDRFRDDERADDPFALGWNASSRNTERWVQRHEMAAALDELATVEVQQPRHWLAEVE